MILTVDIGNSNICFAIHADDSPKPVFFERIHTDYNKTALEYAVDLNIGFSLHGVSPSTITKAALSSVVPSVTKAVKEAMTDMLDCPVREIKWGPDLGFQNLVDDPTTVGNDILCDVAGALQEFAPPIITIDMGTATVAAIIDRDRALRSVLIMAGVRTSMNALSERTSALPAVSLEAPEKAIGRNTVDSMRAGLIYGAAGALDGLIQRIEDETQEHYTVVATGGLSSIVIPCVEHEIHLDPTLLMKGMWSILQR